MAINQLGIIGAPPLLGLVHDLTGGYTALPDHNGIAIMGRSLSIEGLDAQNHLTSPKWCNGLDNRPRYRYIR